MVALVYSAEYWVCHGKLTLFELYCYNDERVAPRFRQSLGDITPRETRQADKAIRSYSFRKRTW